MSHNKTTRREFLRNAAISGAAVGMVPYVFTAQRADAATAKSKNDRLRVGAIGMKYQGSVIAKLALPYADVVAIADVDRQIAEKAQAEFPGKADLYEDYRKMLDRNDIDAITIGTPDHWHTKIVIDACRAGKDVYCEKPLTLTIDEGKRMCKVVEETGRVVQVGSWQRSDNRFRLACEMVRQGRIGKLQSVEVVLGKNKQGGPFKIEKPPAHLNWDMWQGQTPDVPYIKERCHYTFRWWYEYSGGQMTDWGAHHMDIAQWGIGLDHSGPVEVESTAKFPNVKNGYNVAIDFGVKLLYENGVTLEVADNGRNGVMFVGDKGRIFVNRGTVSGKPVEDLKDDPLPREKYTIYKHDNLTRPPRVGKHDAILNHMGNFFDCIQTREKPISDVVSQHRSVSVCHLSNISMWLGRKLKWDPQKELFVGDEEANARLLRPQRKGYEIDA
ncbi:MAG: Gfo/Idh/MocA family oxidoreductase [Pirellulales bacterium]|nr:Gfo/Idh/MocA family oxidoreductase [Pirellulales bacterium]